LSKGAHDADSSGQGNLNIAAEQSRRGYTRGRNIDKLEIQIVFAKKTGVLRNPWQRIRYRLSRIERAELVSRRDNRWHEER
jgi:hypothetical protein